MLLMLDKIIHSRLKSCVREACDTLDRQGVTRLCEVYAAFVLKKTVRYMSILTTVCDTIYK
eukprot:SAG25_NODE_2656_length_1466_cov_34.413419_2_plen_61_part_00